MSTETLSKTAWHLDAAHSEIQFKVKHMMITNVTGKFRSFEVQVETESDDFTTAVISFTADVASIDTGNEQRDQHLRGTDFFDAENFPKLTFTHGKLSKTENGFDLTGQLTIKDTTQEVRLKAEGGHIGKDPWGREKTGFSIEGKINRKDFGLTWNAALEAGGVLVQDEVRILAEIQLAKA